MKTGIVILLLSLIIGCRQSNVVTPDSLYQRWRLVRYQYTNSDQAVDATNADWTITEFRTNGTILYGANGRYTACCSPNRFKREGARLDLVNVESIPIPETSGSCAAVKCAGPGDAWQILLLTPKTLILQTNTGTNFYQPYQ